MDTTPVKQIIGTPQFPPPITKKNLILKEEEIDDIIEMLEYISIKTSPVARKLKF